MGQRGYPEIFRGVTRQEAPPSGALMTKFSMPWRGPAGPTIAPMMTAQQARAVATEESGSSVP